MKVLLILLAVCSCLGHQCYHSSKAYFKECEIPNTVDSDYCKDKRQALINGECAQIVKDFDICKDDLRKLCPIDKENPKGCYRRCIENKLPLFSSECANTNFIKGIVERIRSGRFPYPPVNEIGNDSPKPADATNKENPTPATNEVERPNGDSTHPLPPRGDLPPPRPNGDFPTTIGDIPPPHKGEESSFERPPRFNHNNRIKHSESERREGHRHWMSRIHRRCGLKVKFFALVAASLLFTVGLCWTIRERQRRAFLRRSRVTSTKAPGSWSTGLFGSWDQITPDWKTCLPSFLFPCFQNALNQSELQDRDCTFADFFFNIISYQRHSNTYRDRQEIRARHNIPEDSCGDCLASVFCSPCAIAQNAREIDIRTCAQGGTYWPAQKLPDTWVPAKTDIV